MKFKKLTSYLLMLCLVLNLVVLFPTIASAATTSGTCGDNLTWTLDASGLLTISGTGAMKDYDLHWNSVMGSFYAPWYDYPTNECTKVKAIKIESGITHIGNNAFYKCSNVDEIVLPDTISSIGKFAFWGCSSLKEISIPPQVTSIGFAVFRDCDSLSIIRIGKNVSDIDCNDFDGISGIKGFVVDGNNNYYSTDANGVLYNKNKTKLIKYTTGSTANEYNIPNTVNQIEKYALTAGVNIDISKIEESVAFLMEGKVDYEFRTTVVSELHEIEDILKISEWIKGAKRYFLQNFVDSGNLIEKNILHAVTPENLESMRISATSNIAEVVCR